MPSVKCPFEGCDYVTDDVEATIVVALLEAHTTAHKIGQGATKKTTAEATKDAGTFKPPTRRTGRSKSEKSVDERKTQTELKFRLQICYQYNCDRCNRRESCPFLHLCKAYVESKCDSEKDCSKSHNILDPQVKVILEEHGIDTKRKSKKILPQLQAAVKDNKVIPVQGGVRKASNRSSVKLCKKYNGDGCDEADSCPYLHLCKDLIESKCSYGKECGKSHNILDPQVKATMEKHGNDTKRKPKDIIPDLQSAVDSKANNTNRGKENPFGL